MHPARDTVALIFLQKFARAAGKGPALDSALDALGQRFARKSRGTRAGGGDTSNAPAAP